MKIEVLGMGCPKCKKTTQNAQQAVEGLGIEAQIVKIEDLNKITAYGVVMTPALAINGKVKVSGRIPSIQEIVEWIKEEKYNSL